MYSVWSLIIQSNQGILSLERQIAVEFLNVIFQSCEHNKQHLQALWGEGSLVPDFWIAAFVKKWDRKLPTWTRCQAQWMKWNIMTIQFDYQARVEADISEIEISKPGRKKTKSMLVAWYHQTYVRKYGCLFVCNFEHYVDKYFGFSGHWDPQAWSDENFALCSMTTGWYHKQSLSSPRWLHMSPCKIASAPTPTGPEGLHSDLTETRAKALKWLGG